MEHLFLFDRMRQNQNDLALVCDDTILTYGQLLERADSFGQELQRSGVTGGCVVVIEASFSPNAVGLLLALIQLGAIAVPVSPLARVHRDEYAEIAQASHTFAFDNSDHWTVREHRRSITNRLTKKLVDQGHAGLVIFSSGSTGVPKAVLHDFERLLEKFRPPGHRKRTLAFLLFDHIGGLDTLFGTLANGGTLITTSHRDPDTVCRAIAEHKVHTLPASPTFLNLVLVSDAWRHYDLSSLQVIAYGSEPMPQSLLDRLREVFSNVKFVQTYGMSELGVLKTSSRRDGSLWMKFKNIGFETKVVDGILWVRAESAMVGYLNAPDLFQDDGWLNTEDAVEVDGDYLRILGRVTDLINVGGQKVYPAEVEGVLLTLENVLDATVYGERNPLLGQVLAAKINLAIAEPLDAFKKRLRLHCRERLPSYKIPARIELTGEQQHGHRMKKLRNQSTSATARIKGAGGGSEG